MAHTLEGLDQHPQNETLLLKLINLLLDSQRTFADVGEHLHNVLLKKYCFAESLRRANFRAALENELYRFGVKNVPHAVSFNGAMHRMWDTVRESEDTDDGTLLAIADSGEDETQELYRETLESELPRHLREMLCEQLTHLRHTHDYVCSHRIEMNRPF